MTASIVSHCSRANTQNLNMRAVFVLTFALLVLVAFSGAQKYSQRKRRSKEIEDRISKLDESTKKRISAMKASGMPKEAIAEKIAYVAGGKNVAKRIVDALHDEPEAKGAKKPAAPKPSATKATTTKAAAPPKNAAPKVTQQKPKTTIPPKKTNAKPTNSQRREL